MLANIKGLNFIKARNRIITKISHMYYGPRPMRCTVL